MGQFLLSRKMFLSDVTSCAFDMDALAYLKALKGFKSLYTVISNGLLKLKGRTYH